MKMEVSDQERNVIALALEGRVAVLTRGLAKEVPGSEVYQLRVREIGNTKALRDRFHQAVGPV